MFSITDATATPMERRRARQAFAVFGLYAVGIGGLVAGYLLDRALVGGAIYLGGLWGGFLVAAWRDHVSSVQVADERDRAIERRTSSYTMLAVLVGGLGLFPALFVLESNTEYAMSAAVEGVLYAYLAVCLLWIAVFGVVRYRS